MVASRMVSAGSDSGSWVMMMMLLSLFRISRMPVMISAVQPWSAMK